ncbi:telomere repeats-binding bouquet formation protein 2 [Zootoca vivipara]|uniref:telomere repeats-binding bouquet formation protein 2 n=1 Tax=Zootoca vivipara TaxID=8524 RepID=UPI001590ED38|nr:telomere repeats-binding bouquet formation protein 2 [Zootoca vivipara]
MFRGCSAWFSQSVSHELCGLWVAEGGVITNQDAADYLFSSDASHPDTKRIHQSLDYLEDRVTVFHSSYLAACVNSETKNSTALGHFLLLPACLQQEIRRKNGNFIWEQISNPLKLQPGQPVEVNCHRVEEEIKAKRGLEKSEDNQIPGTVETVKMAYIPLQDYPASNMVMGYPSAKEMNKFIGEIQDFIPGCSDYLAYWIPNETCIFSDLKSKLKRNTSSLASPPPCILAPPLRLLAAPRDISAPGTAAASPPPPRPSLIRRSHPALGACGAGGGEEGSEEPRESCGRCSRRRRWALRVRIRGRRSAGPEDQDSEAVSPKSGGWRRAEASPVGRPGKEASSSQSAAFPALC